MVLTLENYPKMWRLFDVTGRKPACEFYTVVALIKQRIGTDVRCRDICRFIINVIVKKKDGFDQQQ